MTRLAFMLLSAVLILSVTGNTSHKAAADGSQSLNVDPATEAMILQATVRITLIGPRLDESGEPVFNNRNGEWMQEMIFDEGLGTAVLQGKQAVVVTHDHWCMLRPDLVQVRIASHDGRMLAILTGFTFHKLIRYRDGGTLIFSAPEGVQAQTIAAHSKIEAADRVLLAHITPLDGRIQVAPVSVVAVKESGYPQTVRLHAEPDVDISHGSSGGGIWSHGCLAGNLWSVVKQDTAGNGSPVEWRPTAESYAALLPGDLYGGSEARAVPLSRGTVHSFACCPYCVVYFAHAHAGCHNPVGRSSKRGSSS